MNLDNINFIQYLIWNIIDIFFILRYMKHIYGEPGHALIRNIMIMVITLFTTISMHPGENYQNLLAITCMSLFLLPFYPKSMQKKLLFSFVLVAVAGFWTITSGFPSFIINNVIFECIILHIVFWIFLELIPSFIKADDVTIPFYMWMFLLSIPIVSIGVLWCMLILFNSMGYTSTLVVAYLPISLVILYINIMVFFLFSKFAALTNAKTENALLEQQLLLQSKHYENLENAQSVISRVRHDMNNILKTVTHLLDKGYTDELKRYISACTKEIKDVSGIVSTGNTIIDSILNIKLSELQRNNINIKYTISVPQTLNIAFDQTVGLLGNILDNASEACKFLPDTERWIDLNIRYNNNMLYIRLRNPISLGNSQKAYKTESTKNDRILHGIGLKNVQRVVDIYSGTMNTEVNENEFCIKLILYGL